jgi:PRD1 phage membrane DNA delivery
VTENLVSGVVTVLLAIIGVAIIAVLVSKAAQTPQVLSAAGGAFSGTLGAALSPITGGGLGFGGGFSGPAGSLY